MQALILAAGRGKRLNEFSKFQNKCMIKLHDDEPILAFHLKQAVKLGVREIILTVGYLADNIINFFGSSFQGIPIQYVHQKKQQGLVHAIELAAPFIHENFILMLGDEYFIRPRHIELVKYFNDNHLFGVCGVVKENLPESIRKTYTLILGESRRVHRIIEKPRKPSNTIKGTGVCFFKKEILDYIQFTPVHYLRREKELPGLIQEAIDDGEEIKCFFIADKYLNINQAEDLHELSISINNETLSKS